LKYLEKRGYVDSLFWRDWSSSISSWLLYLIKSYLQEKIHILAAIISDSYGIYNHLKGSRSYAINCSQKSSLGKLGYKVEGFSSCLNSIISNYAGILDLELCSSVFLVRVCRVFFLAFLMIRKTSSLRVSGTYKAFY